MATNYNMLKDSEELIINDFKKYYQLLIDLSSNTLEAFIKNDDPEKLFDSLLKEDKKNIRIYHDILNECMWIIQKNEPRANHLRLIISIINSLNDIKRISSYVVNFSKFYLKQKDEISKDERVIIISIYKTTIKTIKGLKEIFDNKEWNETDNSQKLFNEFLKEYKSNFINILKLITDNVVKKKNQHYFSDLIIVLKNLDREVDHCMNILENFSLIN